MLHVKHLKTKSKTLLNTILNPLISGIKGKIIVNTWDFNLWRRTVSDLHLSQGYGVVLQWVYQRTPLLHIYRPPTKLLEGHVFSLSVCVCLRGVPCDQYLDLNQPCSLGDRPPLPIYMRNPKTCSNLFTWASSPYRNPATLRGRDGKRSVGLWLKSSPYNMFLLRTTSVDLRGCWGYPYLCPN